LTESTENKKKALDESQSLSALFERKLNKLKEESTQKQKTLMQQMRQLDEVTD